MPRLINIDSGRVMVVTDLHGAYTIYARYRDRFLELRAQGEVDILLLCGDLIHSEGPAEADGSVELALDLLRLRRELGEGVITLLGNHELPHLYGMTLMKGNHLYTPRFEKTMTEAQRAEIMPFFESLPFYIRTRAGVSIAHAGACLAAYSPAAWAGLINYSHAHELAKVEALLAGQDRASLRAGMGELSGESYADMVAEYLGLTDPNHPRYDDLLRGALTTSPAFDNVWEALFNKNEHEDADTYPDTLTTFLARLSEDYALQSWLVSGHIKVRGGHALVARRQLRLASWTHAIPNEAGQYLLFDAARPITSANGLRAGLNSIFTPTQTPTANATPHPHSQL